MPLNERTALITGGSRGIGKGIALGLAREGVRIAISYRSNKTAAQNTLRQLQERGAQCFAIEADSADPEKVQFLVDKVIERFGRLRVRAEILRQVNLSPQRLAENLIAAAEQWAGTPEQADDITVVVAHMG